MNKNKFKNEKKRGLKKSVIFPPEARFKKNNIFEKERKRKKKDGEKNGCLLSLLGGAF